MATRWSCHPKYDEPWSSFPVFVLFVTIFLISTDNSPIANEESVTICDQESAILECTEYNSYLSIESVFYGRTDNTVCADSHVTDDSQECIISDGPVSRLASVCNGRKQCEVKVKADVWADGRCPETSKYATVGYKCRSKC